MCITRFPASTRKAGAWYASQCRVVVARLAGHCKPDVPAMVVAVWCLQYPAVLSVTSTDKGH